MKTGLKYKMYKKVFSLKVSFMCILVYVYLVEWDYIL